jgi:hypothetical protein
VIRRGFGAWSALAACPSATTPGESILRNGQAFTCRGFGTTVLPGGGARKKPRSQESAVTISLSVFSVANICSSGHVPSHCLWAAQLGSAPDRVP